MSTSNFSLKDIPEDISFNRENIQRTKSTKNINSNINGNKYILDSGTKKKGQLGSYTSLNESALNTNKINKRDSSKANDSYNFKKIIPESEIKKNIREQPNGYETREKQLYNLTKEKIEKKLVREKNPYLKEKNETKTYTKIDNNTSALKRSDEEISKNIIKKNIKKKLSANPF